MNEPDSKKRVEALLYQLEYELAGLPELQELIAQIREQFNPYDLMRLDVKVGAEAERRRMDAEGFNEPCILPKNTIENLKASINQMAAEHEGKSSEFIAIAGQLKAATDAFFEKHEALEKEVVRLRAEISRLRGECQA